MALTAKQKSYLRALAQHRRPIVTIGTAGLTDAVIAEIEIAVARHELLKIRLPAIPRAQREALLEKISEAVRAEPVQIIGRMLVLYRPSDNPKITLPVRSPVM